MAILIRSLNLYTQLAFVSLVLLMPFLTKGQQLANLDSTKALPLKEVYILVEAFHPMVKQAKLLSDAAQQELRMSRGGFDPKANLEYNEKTFDNKNYYSLFDSYLKVPTWVGLDFVGGYERNTGLDLNSTENTANGKGIAYLGASLPIGAGLFIDQRRATLKQAEIGLNMAEAERLKAINKIILQVAKDYWAWYEAWKTVRNISLGYAFAVQRFDAVQQRVIVGDLARIDTVEARIAIQDRGIALQNAQLEYLQAKLAFEVHLWAEDGAPRSLQDGIVPIYDELSKSQQTTAQLLELANQRHPEILKLKAKIDQLEVDRRLSVENLKPTINLKYNFLTGKNGPTADETFSQHNYKIGVQAQFPLYFRKERGKLGLTKVKLSQGQLELVQQRRTIQNEILAAASEFSTLGQLMVNQEKMVINYQTLRDAENDKFDNGESSLFLVNSRETKLIESRIKLASYQSKYQKSKFYLLWSAGLGLE